MPSGAIADLSFAVQSAKGAVPSATNRVYLAGGSPIQPVKTGGVQDSTLTQPIPVSAFGESIRVAGVPSIWMRPDAIGLLLYAVLGAKVTTGAADPYTHALTPATTQPWVTFWRGLGGIVNERFDDCKVSSLRITSQAGRPVMVTIGVMGITGRYRNTAETSVAVELAPPFMHYHGAGALKVENVAVTAIDDWELTIDRGVVARDTLLVYDVKTGPRITATMTVGQIITNADLWNRFMYTQAAPANNQAALIDPLILGSTGLSFRLLAGSSDPVDLLDLYGFNASFDSVSLANWYNAGTSNTLTRDTAQFQDGVASVRLDRNVGSGTGFIRLLTTPAINVVPGRLYTASGYRRSTVSRPLNMVMPWYDAAGSWIGEIGGMVNTDGSGAWSAIPSISAVAPPLAVSARVGVYSTAGTIPEGESHWIDNIGWSGPVERTVQIDLPRVAMTGIDGLTHSASGNPLRHTATYTTLKPAGVAITATVKNGRSTY